RATCADDADAFAHFRRHDEEEAGGVRKPDGHDPERILEVGRLERLVRQEDRDGLDERNAMLGEVLSCLLAIPLEGDLNLEDVHQYVPRWISVKADNRGGGSHLSVEEDPLSRRPLRLRLNVPIRPEQHGRMNPQRARELLCAIRPQRYAPAL